MSIEKHASKIDTRAMFDQFGNLIYQAHAYRVEELEKTSCIGPHISKLRGGRNGPE